jgi:hypothetical protein
MPFGRAEFSEMVSIRDTALVLRATASQDAFHAFAPNLVRANAILSRSDGHAKNTTPKECAEPLVSLT